MRPYKQFRVGFRDLTGRRKCNGLLLMLAVLLASCSGSSSQDTVIVDDDTELPSPPVNVLATVYSSTDAELSWDAAQDDGWIMGYEIVRDGEP